MKQIKLVIAIAFLITGCIGKKDEPVSGRFLFPNTSISVQVPNGWMQTNIPGYKYPVLFGDIQYGIKPNIRLEEYASGKINSEIQNEFFNKMEIMYPDISIKSHDKCHFATGELQCSKIVARRINNDKIPIVHIIYILTGSKNVIIFTGTCAEPTLKNLDAVFDTIIKSAEIK